MSTEPLERAVGVAKQVLAGVQPEQLGLPTPCKSWDVSALINHIVGGSFWFGASMEAGESPADDESPDFASGDFAASYEDGSKQAVAAFGAPGALEKMVKLPFGEFPGAAFMGLATVDTFTHAWDLAKATGQDTDLDPEFARQLLQQAQGMIPNEVRGDEPMPFGPTLEAGPTACAADELAAFLGRTVS